MAVIFNNFDDFLFPQDVGGGESCTGTCTCYWDGYFWDCMGCTGACLCPSPPPWTGGATEIIDNCYDPNAATPGSTTPPATTPPATSPQSTTPPKTSTPTPTPASTTPLPSPSISASATPIPSPSISASATPIPSPSISPSATPIPSPSISPSATPIPSPSISPSATPIPSPSISPSATPLPSPSISASATPTTTASPTPSPSPSNSPSPTPSPSPSPTVTASPTITPSPTVTPSQTITPAPTLLPNALFSWGLNSYGQLALDDTNNRSYPTQTIDLSSSWVSVFGNRGVVSLPLSQTAAGIKSDGSLWLWGYNAYGYLGLNFSTNCSSPAQVYNGGTNWQQIGVGYGYQLAVKTDGSLWAWGQNVYGVFGNDSVNDITYSPVNYIAGNTWSKIYTGYTTAAAIKADNTLWMWGRNAYGQLGTNDTTDYSSPVQIGTNNWIAANAGIFYTGGIKSDNTLWMWGANNYGQLGIGVFAGNYSIPIQVGTNSDWSQIYCGTFHTAAIKIDGTLWLWGQNKYGELGINDINNFTASPIQVFGGGSWSSVACGEYHTVAVKTNGTLWAWGENSYGQVGNNLPVGNYTTPEQIVSSNSWSTYNKVGASSSSSFAFGLPLASGTPSPTASPSPSPTPSFSPSPSPTPSPSPSESPSPTPSPSPSNSPSPTPSPSPSNSPSPTPSFSPSPSPTPSPSPSNSPSPTPSPSPSNSPSPTPSPSPSNSPSPTPSNSATSTPTPSPTKSPTPTPSISPSNTPSPTISGTPTPTPSFSPTATISPTPSTSATPTSTPTPTPSSTQPTPTPSQSQSPTPTPTPSASLPGELVPAGGKYYIKFEKVRYFGIIVTTYAYYKTKWNPYTTDDASKWNLVLVKNDGAMTFTEEDVKTFGPFYTQYINPETGEFLGAVTLIKYQIAGYAERLSWFPVPATKRGTIIFRIYDILGNS